MDRNQDVEVELYEENVGNLNYSTPKESWSSSPDRFLPVLLSQEPTQRRLEEIPFVAIDPRPDPEEFSHAPTSQVPRIHDSCHTCIALYAVILEKGKGVRMYGMFFFLICFWVVLSCSVFVQKHIKPKNLKNLKTFFKKT